MQECSGLSAFLFISVDLRDQPRKAFVHIDLLKQMKKYSFRRSQLKAVIWTLLVSATVDLDMPEEIRFVAEITNMLIYIQFLQWESIDAIFFFQEIIKSKHLIILSKVLLTEGEEEFRSLEILAMEQM